MSAQSVFESTLPILLVKSEAQIQDEPKVPGSIKIIDSGGINSSDSQVFVFESDLAIEKRGNSSLAFFPKNNYGFELRDAENVDYSAPLLGMPSEEDWILHGPYSDKTLLRNMLAFELGSTFDNYSPRTRLVELVLNNNYHGVYVLMEKIKRDNDRVDIAKLDADDIAGDSLTGGYIFRVDHGDPEWFSLFGVQGNNNQKLGFQNYYPKRENMQFEQKEYLETYVDSFEYALRSTTKTYGGKHIRDYIDLESFAEHFLINEYTNNVDAYRLSAYLHKDKKSKGGKIKAGPIWDYNLAFGNADYCNGVSSNLWMYTGECSYTIPFWWQELMNMTEFQTLVRCKWEEVKNGKFHPDYLHSVIDQHVENMGDAVERNFDRWDVLGFYVWPNGVVFSSYQSEINFFKNYIEDRWEFLDGSLPNVCTTPVDEVVQFSANLYPNPATSDVRIDLVSGSQDITVMLSSSLGTLIRQIELKEQTTNTISVKDLNSGIYVIQYLDSTSGRTLYSQSLVVL